MLKGKAKIQMPTDLDEEISELISLINDVEGIETTNSCFGHNEMPIQIWGVADNIEALHEFMYKYFYCNQLWHFELCLSDVMIDNKEWGKIEFLLKSDDRYISFPATQLMAQDLTKSFKLKQMLWKTPNDIRAESGLAPLQDMCVASTKDYVATRNELGVTTIQSAVRPSVADTPLDPVTQECVNTVRKAIAVITRGNWENYRGALTEECRKALEELEGLDLYWICDPEIKRITKN